MPSAVIRGLAHDPGETLTVTFVTWRRYVYAGVPEEVAGAFAGRFPRDGFSTRRSATGLRAMNARTGERVAGHFDFPTSP